MSDTKEEQATYYENLFEGMEDELYEVSPRQFLSQYIKWAKRAKKDRELLKEILAKSQELEYVARSMLFRSWCENRIKQHLERK